MIEEFVLLLDCFHPHVPDKESNRIVELFCQEKHRWADAHGLFTTIRTKTLKAEASGNKIAGAQYLFEEAISKTLYNLSKAAAPFDPDSPYWVIKNALTLARCLNIPQAEITDIVA